MGGLDEFLLFTKIKCGFFLNIGHESDVRHWCPVMLLSNFTYSHNDGSATTCGASNSDLAVCPSWTTMTFNYASCSTVQGFSGRLLFHQEFLKLLFTWRSFILETLEWSIRQDKWKLDYSVLINWWRLKFLLWTFYMKTKINDAFQLKECCIVWSIC